MAGLGGSLAGVARVLLRVDDGEYNRDLDRARTRFRSTASEIERDSGRLTRGALAGSGAFRSLGRSVAFASGAFLGAAGLTSAVRAGYDELSAQAKAAAQTEAALKSTGQVAGVTARHIDDLSKSLLRKTGIDDEVIKSGQNLLLTFTNIRNVAGENNDIFDQATELTLDLSVAFHKDLNNSAILVGKALQDPIRGLVALRRVGVQFTQAQQDQIKALVRSGHTLDAQRIILAELRRELGGSAEAAGKTLPGQLRILHETTKNLEATLLKGTLPAFRSLVEWLQKQVDAFSKNTDAQRQVKQAFVDTKNILVAVVDVVRTVVGALGGMKNTLELLLALKVVSVLTGWTSALRLFVGAEAAGTGVAGAAGATGRLNKQLGILRTLSSKPFQIFIAYEIVKKLTGSNADLSNDITGGDYSNLPDGFVVTDYAGRVMGIVRGGKLVPAGKAGGAAPGASSNPAAAAKQQGLVQTARQLGPGSGGVYVKGGIGGTAVINALGEKSIGYDCSGYLYDIYKRNGINIPRTSEAQWADPHAIQVPKGAEQPGDGVYFTGSSQYTPPGHCGIYVGNDAFIEYYQSGKPARTSKLSDQSDYWGARRWVKIVKQAGGGGGGADAPQADPGKAPKPKKAKKAALADLIPARLEVALTKAEIDKSLPAQLKALAAIEDYLDARLAHEKNINKRLDLLNALKSTRDRISGIKDDQASAAADKAKLAGEKDMAAFTAGIAGVIAKIKATITGGHGDLLQTVDVTDATAAIAQAQEALNIAQTRYTEAVKKFGEGSVRTASAHQAVVHAETALAKVQAAAAKGVAGKVIGRDFVGGTEIKLDPKTGKYIVVKVKPDVDKLKAELDHILKAVLPKIDREIKALKAAIARLAKHPKKNKVQLAQMRAKLKLKQDERAEIVALAKDLAISIDDIAAALAIDPEPEPVDGGSGTLSIPDDTSGGGGGDSGGSSVQAGPTQAEIDAQINAQTLGFLTGVRGLRSYEENLSPAQAALLDPLARLGGASIVVNNFNQPTPQDPHLWSSQVLFDLKALVG